MLVKSLFQYLAVWIKDNGQETVKFSCQVCTSQTRFYVKISVLQICLGFRSSFSELLLIMKRHYFHVTSGEFLGKRFYQNQYDFLEVHR